MNKQSFEFPFNDEPFDKERAIQLEQDTDIYLDGFFESLRD